jgi:hypothetical protein
MKLALHQLRFDVRAFRLALGFWLALLGLNLAENLGWLGFPDPESFFNNNTHLQFWNGALLVVLWAVGLILPALVVLADSPAKTDAFLSTRPLPKRDLYAAKALFIGLLIVAPLVVQEVCYLMFNRAGFHFVIHGAFERLLWATLIVALSATFACIWRDAKEWVAGLALTLVAGWISVFLLVMLFVKLASEVPHEPAQGPVEGITPALVYLAFAALGFALLATLNHYYRWSPFWRGFGGVVLLLSGYVVSVVWPWDFFPIKPGDPAALAALEPQIPFPVAPRDFRVTWTYKPRASGQLEVQTSLTPDSRNLPENITVNWNCEKSELVPTKGNSMVFNSPQRAGVPRSLREFKTTTDLRNIARLLGPDTLLTSSSFGTGSGGEQMVPVGDFTAPDRLLNEPAILKADFTGQVWRLERVAALPYVKGATASEATGVWKILGVLKASQVNNLIQPERLLLEHDRIALNTTGDVSLRPLDSYYSDFDLVLYDETTQLAQPVATVGYDVLKLGSETAYPRQFYLCYAQGTTFSITNSPVDPKSLKLFILRKRYLGTVKRHWESPAFNLEDSADIASQGPLAQSGQISAAEFNQRLAAINPPGPQAARREVGAYLADLLRLVESVGRPLPPGTPAAAQLALLVPAHLDVFLDGVMATRGFARVALLHAITRGAEENQKLEIIATLQRAPDLAEVILQRGWMMEAREALHKLPQSRQPLGQSAFQALAWFDDPATYPALLDEFAANPRKFEFDLLRSLQGIEPGLDETVTRIWHNWPRLLEEDGSISAEPLIALRAGRQEALAEVFRIFHLNLKQSGSLQSLNGSLLYTLRNAIEWPADLRDKFFGDDAALADWLAQHRADDFQFDPLRQHFVLKQP